MQTEVTDMVATLLHAPEGFGAGFTAGGTESILMSVLVARERAKAERGVTAGNVVFPSSAHPAFAKSCFYLGLEPRVAATTSDFVADVDSVADTMDDQTVLVVGSSYCFPHGVVDPISELAALAQSRVVPFHSDSCIGAFVLPFLERLGHEVPPFDFRVPGVTQMSGDLHKYGYVTKGASVVTYREASWFKHQVFEYDVWPAGRYRNASVAGARAASPVAASWVLLRYLGEDGYVEIMRGLMETTTRIRAGLGRLGLRVLGNPLGPLLAFTAEGADIFAVADVMDKKGWNLNRVHRPSGLQMMIAPHHAAHVDAFLADLEDALAHHGPASGSTVAYS
jgi:glutamate/tyrosine decarboxylase-like PLP-dependent enzyme